MSGAAGFGLCTAIAAIAVIASCVPALHAAHRARAAMRRVTQHPIHGRLTALVHAFPEAAAAGGRLWNEAARLLEIGLSARETLAVVAALLRV